MSRGRAQRVVAAGVLALLATLAHAADVTRGGQVYEARCGGCHSVEADRIGPRHAHLAGRRAGSLAGFDYSPALRNSSVVWTAMTLDRWLADPENLIPGQRMNYRIDDAAERADIVAWLLTLQ
jgi:cytochrome c